MTQYFHLLASPVGTLKLVATDNGLAAILWDNDNPRRVPLGNLATGDSHPVLLEAARQLNEYFEGHRKSFTVPFDRAGTPFQKDVWLALETIPFGETRTYSDIARQIGRPSAVRAVGAANGRNPISIIVPCHRVIGSNGKLTGFAGGLETKDFLLKMESAGRHESGARQAALSLS
jgi:methylated-DNA-[protein]-cysteine S-methyltransferase